MYALPIGRDLSEDTRLQTVVLHLGHGVYEPGIYDLHEGVGDDKAFYVTEHGDASKIYMAISQELWVKMFEKK